MSIPETPEVRQPKLPVWRTAGDAYGIIFRNFGVFVSLAAIPMVISLPINISTMLAQPITLEDYQAATTQNLWWHLLGIVQQLIWAIFAVSWHRFVLLGRKDSTSPLQFRLRRRELRFFLYSMAFLMPIYVASVAFDPWFGLSVGDPSATANDSYVRNGLILAAVGVATVIVAIFFVLIFPAIAVDNYKGLRAAWRQLSGSTWRLVWTNVLVVAPFIFIIGPIGSGISQILLDKANDIEIPWTEFVVLLTVNSLIGFLLAAVAVSILSLAYRHLSGWTPPLTLPETEGE